MLYGQYQLVGFENGVGNVGSRGDYGHRGSGRTGNSLGKVYLFALVLLAFGWNRRGSSIFAFTLELGSGNWTKTIRRIYIDSLRMSNSRSVFQVVSASVSVFEKGPLEEKPRKSRKCSGDDRNYSTADNVCSVCFCLATSKILP